MSDIILNKIQKLLNLGNSPNEAEAQAAIEKAHFLLKEYNLSIRDIKQNSQYDIKEEVIYDSKNESKWRTYIMIGVATANYCKHIQYKSNKSTTSKFIGKEHNVIASIHMTEYLFSVVERLAKKYSGSTRGDYKTGLSYRLCDRLCDINKKEEEECNALVVQEESTISKYLNEQGRKIREVSTKVRAKNLGAFIAGTKDADSINLSNQIDSKHSSKQIGVQL